MKGKKESKYNPKPEPEVEEDMMITTELSDEADNELYIRYKIARFNPEQSDEQKEEERKSLLADISALKSIDSIPMGKNKRDIMKRVREYQTKKYKEIEQ
jgi:hypothetical protein